MTHKILTAIAEWARQAAEADNLNPDYREDLLRMAHAIERVSVYE